jgi:predicted P-loop ATPase
VNQNEFLTDVTGNRRFLCFEAKNIDHEHSVNMDLVFSQALFHFRSGYQYYLDKADIEELNQSNERFRYLSIEEEALLNNFETCEADDNATYMTNSEILSVIAEEMKIRTDQASKKRLGMALAKYNYWRGKKGGRWVYAVKEKKSFPATCLYKDLTKSEDAA